MLEYSSIIGNCADLLIKALGPGQPKHDCPPNRDLGIMRYLGGEVTHQRNMRELGQRDNAAFYGIKI